MLITILFLLSACTGVINTTHKTITKPQGVLIISIPKAGTHLLAKCVHLILQECPQNNNCPPLVYPICSHVKYTQRHTEPALYKNNVKFFIYRDPRDQIISFILYLAQSYIQAPDLYNAIQQNPTLYIEKFNQGSLGIFPFGYASYANMPLPLIIHHFITQGSPIYNRVGGPYIDPYPPINTIQEFYHAYLPWKQEPEFLVIRFEDLIGPQGGGNLATQLLCIQNIAQHLGIDITLQQIDNVSKNLFGQSPTFREGQIGSWKKYFTIDNKATFKKTAHQLLIDLGYENDNSW